MATGAWRRFDLAEWRRRITAVYVTVDAAATPRRVGVSLAALFVTIRIVTVWGRPIERFPDSDGYFVFDVTGGSSRLWPVPLLYGIVTGDSARVALHVVLACAAWLWLAWAVGRVTPAMPRLAPALVLVLGTTPQVARWDLTILSESIGISVMVATIACWLTASVLRRRGWWIAAASLTAVAGMTRTAQVPLLVLVATGATVALAVCVARRAESTMQRQVAALLIVAGGLAVLQTVNNHGMSTLNFYTVISDRVLGDAERTEWFREQGMPWRTEFAEARGYVYRSDVPADVVAYLDLPPEQAPPEMMAVGGREFAVWARNDGWGTYVGYLLTHPRYTLTDPVNRLDTMLDPADRDLLPLDPREVVPRGLFGAWQGWLAAAVVLLAAAWRRNRATGGPPLTAAIIPSAIIALCVPWFYLVALGSGIEHPRHAITLAVALRIGCLVLALVSWDRLQRPPSAESTQ